MFTDLCLSNKPCELMKPIRTPKYGSRTVLTDSSWEYVALYLKRHSTKGASDALFYWEQAHSFYLASQTLPDSARPLTSYYCILNASKALLRFKSVGNERLSSHGISTVRETENKASFEKAETAVKGAGVLPELAKYFNCYMQPGHYYISRLMYNIPCVHRAYCISLSKSELFIPLENPTFVRKEGSSESWIKFSFNARYANAKSLQHIPAGFEKDIGVTNSFVIRMKRRFKWDKHTPIERRKELLQKYHEKVRRYLHYVYGERKLWYVKKEMTGNEQLYDIKPIILIFCVFHWLSELVRYNPILFQKYMKSKQNWLIHEFICKGLSQFVDEISCEITGQDIMCTGTR